MNLENEIQEMMKESVAELKEVEKNDNLQETIDN